MARREADKFFASVKAAVLFDSPAAVLFYALLLPALAGVVCVLVCLRRCCCRRCGRRPPPQLAINKWHDTITEVSNIGWRHSIFGYQDGGTVDDRPRGPNEWLDD
jgi:hypothetical protein